MPANDAAVERADRLRKRYTADVPPPCRVCGRELRIQRAGGGCVTEWGCDGLESDPDNPGMLRRAPDYDPADDHYIRSKWTQYRTGDQDVLDLLESLRTPDAAEVERLREAVRYAEAVFDDYVSMHHAKDTSDGYAKAERNRAHRDKMRAALAALPGRG
jgi:hypothetical protein